MGSLEGAYPRFFLFPFIKHAVLNGQTAHTKGCLENRCANYSTDKINSDLGTVVLARPTSHTGCTQALWHELGVRNGGCEVAYVSW